MQRDMKINPKKFYAYMQCKNSTDERVENLEGDYGTLALTD